MREFVFLLLLGIVAASCSSNSHQLPQGILPSQKMETIVWQLMQADEYVNTLLAKDSTKKNSTERMKRYQQVFELNKTSMAEFKKSYQFYMLHPDITKIVFDSVIARANRNRSELYKPKTDTAVKDLNMPGAALRPVTAIQ